MSLEDDRESYLRWQGLAIKQLGNTINLFLTLGSAAISLALKILIESQSPFPGAARCLFYWALLFLGFSVGAALSANCTRAFDFRHTRRAARERMKDGKDHDEFHDKAECYGKWTWRIFLGQTVTFGLGVILLALSIVLAYAGRI
jgi:hypothetical protein